MGVVLLLLAASADGARVKLRKKDRVVLQRVLTDLERGQAYLRQPSILIGYTGGVATTTLHFVNARGEVFYALDKEIGSELALLHNGIRVLREVLAEAEV